MREVIIKTLIFKDVNDRRISGTADGFVNADDVMAVVSATTQHPEFDELTDGKPVKKSGDNYSVLHLRGGSTLTVLGAPVVLRKQLSEAKEKETSTENTSA